MEKIVVGKYILIEGRVREAFIEIWVCSARSQLTFPMDKNGNWGAIAF
jgi:hypothetical protein